MNILRNINFLLGLLFISCTIYAQDTLEVSKHEPADEVFAESDIQSKIIYGALDSQSYDHKLNQVHLYGSAFVNYEDKRLNADYILLDLTNSFADARKMPFNPFGSRPTFFDRNKEYTYNRLKYDFEDEKGYVHNALSSEGEFIIHGERTKYVGPKSNTFSDEQTVYNANSLITTCNHPDPHFGFRAKRLKVIPEKVAVVGPSNLELEGIPTPLWLPFGFYPLTQGKSSGFIFPQDYEFNSRNKGFGLRGFGWYFPINDYVHFRLTADVYTRGSYAIYTNTAYKKKYKYDGSVYFSFDDTRTEDVESAEVLSRTGFTLRLNHRQDSKAHPFIDIGGTINLVGNNNQQRVANDAQSVLTTTYTSNFFYRHSMPGTPFSFSLGLNHNQNTNTNIVNITLPDIKLNMNTIFPFVKKNRGSNKEKWYEKISFDYDLKFKSFVNTTDSTLFTKEMYDNVKTGMNHKMATGFSTRVLKYFNLVPRASYEETWVLNTIEKENHVRFNENVQSFSDSIVTNTLTGFDAFREYSAGISLNTQIFGTKTFAKGWLRGIRHTMKPDIGYAYAPDTRSIYIDTLDLANERVQTYTRFDNGPFNTPSFGDLRSQITYRLGNILELKYFSKKDSTEKKLKLFDNLTINGSYNFAADSLKWSRITVASTSRFFNGITTLQTNFNFDPYIKVNNRTVNTTTWSENGKLVRLERGNIRLSTRLNVRQIQELLGNKSDRSSSNSSSGQRSGGSRAPEGVPPQFQNQGDNQEEDSSSKDLITLMDIFNGISINHELRYDMISRDGEVTSDLTTHSLAFSGIIPLTDNWTVSIGNLGYDFIKEGLSYTAISFSRKLHCWNMNFSWYPNRDTYSFFIGVNSSNLSFLKYNYGQNNVDGFFGRIP